LGHRARVLPRRGLVPAGHRRAARRAGGGPAAGRVQSLDGRRDPRGRALCSADAARGADDGDGARGERLSLQLQRADSAVRTRCPRSGRSEEHTSELQSRSDLVCRLLLEKKKNKKKEQIFYTI